MSVQQFSLFVATSPKRRKTKSWSCCSCCQVSVGRNYCSDSKVGWPITTKHTGIEVQTGTLDPILLPRPLYKLVSYTIYNIFFSYMWAMIGQILVPFHSWSICHSPQTHPASSPAPVGLSAIIWLQKVRQGQPKARKHWKR